MLLCATTPPPPLPSHFRPGRKKSNLRMVSLIKRGCLPTYQQVGPLSTVLLVACRLMQGVSVGGQLPASLIYTVEMSPKEHWGYYGSLVMMSGEQHASYTYSRIFRQQIDVRCFCT